MKKILITGSGRGIGRAIAERAHQLGYQVILHCRKKENSILDLQKKLPGSLLVLFDLNNSVLMKNKVEQLIQNVGKIDVLVNNAGILVWKPLIEQSEDEIEQVLRTNLESPIRLTRFLLPNIAEGIINIASGAGKDNYQHSLKNETVYAASKFGFRGFSIALAQEHPDLKILCVNPGGIATQMNDWQGASPDTLAEEIFHSFSSLSLEDNYQDLDIFWQGKSSHKKVNIN